MIKTTIEQQWNVAVGTPTQRSGMSVLSLQRAVLAGVVCYLCVAGPPLEEGDSSMLE